MRDPECRAARSGSRPGWRQRRREVIAGDGVEIVAGANVLAICDDYTIAHERSDREHTPKVDAILAATGRRPASAGLGPNKTGMRATEYGATAVGEYLRTSQPHIFTLGDVNGGPQFTYVSLYDSRIMLDQLPGSGKRSTADRIAVPQTLHMPPPPAIGLTS